jgi:hypothetical protein
VRDLVLSIAVRAVLVAVVVHILLVAAPAAVTSIAEVTADPDLL